MKIAPCHLAICALAVAGLGTLPTEARASQSGRPPGRCAPAAASTMVDSEVAAEGNRFDTGRRTSGKLQIGGNITDIVLVRNHTDCPVRLQIGFGSEIIEVAPRGFYSGHMWVPWADAPYSQSLSIYIDGQVYFYVWQMAGRVAFRSDAEFRRLIAPGSQNYRDNYGRALSVPGIGTEGGPRALHIAATADGKPFFKIEGITEEQ